MNPIEWTNAFKALAISGVNLAIQGLTLFNIWDPTADQENWLIAIVNLGFAGYVLFTYKLSPKRMPE